MTSPASGFAVHTSVLEPEIELVERISRTNLSEVWRGRRRADGSQVAVKFALTEAAAAMLEPEAAIVRELRREGPTISVKVPPSELRKGTREMEVPAQRVKGVVPAEYAARPVPHLVMPWVGGRTFRNLIEEIRSGDDRSRAAGTLYDVVRIVARVHGRGFMHGDLKPENILLDDAGRPWLTDFGMARAIHVARLDTRVSRSVGEGAGAWGGTLHYLPPEGIQGDPPAFSWDVYAIGVMLHEVLLGTRPDRAASPESLRASLPDSILDVLLAALAWSPADRIPNVPSLLTVLKPIQTELTLVGRARLVRRFGRASLNALAAFFVVFRYVSVLALLSLYAITVIWALRGPWGMLFLFVPVLYLHYKISWEGPETGDEAQSRVSGRVVTGPNAPPRLN
ncbi:MAG: protein kinase [Planctomycetes bacterium]|nr:protein kinase [Planctomycetota bacterium]